MLSPITFACILLLASSSSLKAEDNPPPTSSSSPEPVLPDTGSKPRFVHFNQLEPEENHFAGDKSGSKPIYENPKHPSKYFSMQQNGIYPINRPPFNNGYYGQNPNNFNQPGYPGYQGFLPAGPPGFLAGGSPGYFPNGPQGFYPGANSGYPGYPGYYPGFHQSGFSGFDMFAARNKKPVVGNKQNYQMSDDFKNPSDSK